MDVPWNVVSLASTDECQPSSQAQASSLSAQYFKFMVPNCPRLYRMRSSFQCLLNTTDILTKLTRKETYRVRVKDEVKCNFCQVFQIREFESKIWPVSNQGLAYNMIKIQFVTQAWWVSKIRIQYGLHPGGVQTFNSEALRSDEPEETPAYGNSKLEDGSIFERRHWSPMYRKIRYWWSKWCDGASLDPSRQSYAEISRF